MILDLSLSLGLNAKIMTSVGRAGGRPGHWAALPTTFAPNEDQLVMILDLRSLRSCKSKITTDPASPPKSGQILDLRSLRSYKSKITTDPASPPESLR